MAFTSFYAIIVAGGQGQRTGLPLPKQYALLGGRAVLDWSVAAFARHPACQGIVIVVPEGDEERARYAITPLGGDAATLRIVAGGATRQASVAAGLRAVEALDNGRDSFVLVHDAARPGVTDTVIDALLSTLNLEGTAGAIPALPVADTLAISMNGAQDDVALGDVVPRDGLVRVQTPQGFRRSNLQAAHAAWNSDSATDDAQMVRAAGGQVALVPGDIRLDKITNAGDLEHMERIVTDGTPAITMFPTTGMGFDVHRLVPGDGLWLGGVFIAHNHTLKGHSDADVLLHALTDALLGAIADGDIGGHFPPSDPQWRGASSDQFLVYARNRVAAHGARITHVDCTVMCEAPKVGPHRDIIRARIAELLALPLTRVAVKATTTEQLGFTGRGEGIAAQAIVTVLRPED